MRKKLYQLNTSLCQHKITRSINQLSTTVAYIIKRQADVLFKLYITLPLYQGLQKPVRVDLIYAMFSVFNYATDAHSVPLNESLTVFTLFWQFSPVEQS